MLSLVGEYFGELRPLAMFGSPAEPAPPSAGKSSAASLQTLGAFLLKVHKDPCCEFLK